MTVNTNIRLRNAVAGDGALLAVLNAPVQELHALNEPSVFRADPGPDEVAKFFEDTLAKPRSKIVIAFWGDDPAGYIWYNYKERPDSVFKSARSSLYIHQIATLAEFRRKGVGRALMELALESGRDHGAEYIDLDYWVFNAEARQFFKSFGFLQYNVNMRLGIK